MTKQAKYSIVIPVGMKPRPKIHEETAAEILANHFKSDVHFLETGSQGTPDVSVQGVEWELKSPIGGSKNNTRKNMREAGKQSVNIIIDLRRSKLHQTRALGYINEYMSTSKKLKHVVVITKSKRILTIK
ncbi:MAG TPA: hypothetical protein VJ836_04610 [Candidatus Saccharimonadales bacterium]|nr:hypothetical protein [Candidatus Saccharimonadales bacterium]